MSKAPMKTPMQVHFMGIGGSGQSAVARMAKESGFDVSGCDLEENGTTYRLRKEGIPVSIGHDVSHLKGVNLVAHTPAVFDQSANHPEFLQANRKGIAMIWEKFMASYLQKDKFVVAVAGTHGKGHTAAMISLIMQGAGLNPTCEIGANLLNWDRKNYQIGKGKYFVCEADEFREKFLLYRPNLAIVTSVEMDHPDFFKDLNAVLNSFKKFVFQLQEPKILVINAEDPGCIKLVKLLKSAGWKSKVLPYKKTSGLKLKLPGDHLRSDAAGAYGAAKALGIAEKQIKAALESFSGLERRFEFKGEVEGAKIYDDYAHHPTAVEANIKAAKSLKPSGKVWAVFQPHMYGRLEALFEDFKKALKASDRVVVTDVYTRREQGKTKPSGKDLALAIGAPKATYVGGDLLNVANFIHRNVEKGDLVLLMGAGDINRVSDILLAKNG